MVQFNFYGNPVLTEEEFTKLVSTDQGLRNARYALKYEQKPTGKTAYYVGWPSYKDVRDITEQQLETALRLYEQRREEVRTTIKDGTLFITCMGGDYKPTCPDGIGNYRVRIRFIDNNGDLRGCEFSPFASNTFPNEAGGFAFSRWNSSEEQRKNDEYNSRIVELEKKYQGRKIPAREMPEFPVTYADRGIVTDLQFTGDGLCKWMKREHGLNFTSAYIDRYFFNCDEITSISLK